MRKLARMLPAVLLLAAALGVAPAAAAPPAPLAFIEIWQQIDYPVEQQTEEWMLWDPIAQEFYPNPDHSTWAQNPTNNCMWDLDDQQRWWNDPYANSLPAGASASQSICYFADERTGSYFVTVIAPSAGLSVQLDTLGHQFTFSAVQTGGKQWTYRGCVVGPNFSSSAVANMPEIPGSNGGFALPGAATLTIGNPTSKAVKPITVDFDHSQISGGWICAPTRTASFANQYGGYRLSWE